MGTDFDSGAEFLVRWLHLGHHVDTPALMLQRVSGVAAGCDSQGRGLAEVAALDFLDDDIWVDRMEALVVAMCRPAPRPTAGGCILGSALQSLPDGERQAGLAALARFAPAGRARLDAARLEHGKAAAHGLRRV